MGADYFTLDKKLQVMRDCFTNAKINASKQAVFYRLRLAVQIVHNKK